MVAIGDAAGEQEPETATNGLYAGRDPGIGRFEEEMVSTLDVLCLRDEIPGQDQKIQRVAIRIDASPDASCGLHRQRHRQVEPSRFEVEFRVHE
jgi:hypothetical protein